MANTIIYSARSRSRLGRLGAPSAPSAFSFSFIPSPFATRHDGGSRCGHDVIISIIAATIVTATAIKIASQIIAKTISFAQPCPHPPCPIPICRFAGACVAIPIPISPDKAVTMPLADRARARAHARRHWSNNWIAKSEFCVAPMRGR